MAKRQPSKPKNKGGRPGLSEAELLARGSWRGRKKRRERLAKEQGQRVRREDIKVPRLTAKKLEAAICCLPGFDPYRCTGGAVFVPEAARHAINWYERELSHVKGPNALEPFILCEWEVGVVGNLFGWIHPETSLRRFRKVFIFVARGNGKSSVAAATVAYVLLEDGENFAEIYGVAAEYEQAAYVYDHARGMIEQNPALLERVQIYRGQQKGIRLLSDNSMYSVKSADKKGKHGGNTHLLVIDELHAIEDQEYIDALETGLGKRLQPIELILTTSDWDRESSCNEEHEYACKVRDGIIDDHRYLPAIFEAHRDDDYTSHQTWKKANPTYPVSPTHEYLESMCQKAKDRPSFLNTFKRLHLNIRTESATRWLPMEKWNDDCVGSVDLEELRGKTCFGGLDLASTLDLTAFVLLFPVKQQYKLVPYFWVPSEIAKDREKKNRPMLMNWVRQGLIKATEGNITDYAVVREDINAIGEQFGIQGIGVDMSFQGAQLATDLQSDGFALESVSQGFATFAAPTLELETLVISGRIEHGANPVMRWMASNVGVDVDRGGRMRPTKTTVRGKIDGIVCAIMALLVAMTSTNVAPIYQTRGLTWI